MLQTMPLAVSAFTASSTSSNAGPATSQAPTSADDPVDAFTPSPDWDPSIIAVTEQDGQVTDFDMGTSLLSLTPDQQAQYAQQLQAYGQQNGFTVMSSLGLDLPQPTGVASDPQTSPTVGLGGGSAAGSGGGGLGGGSAAGSGGGLGGTPQLSSAAGGGLGG